MTATAVDGAFVTNSRGFEQILGDAPRLWLLVPVDAHEGPVYFADEHALYCTTLP